MRKIIDFNYGLAIEGALDRPERLTEAQRRYPATYKAYDRIKPQPVEEAIAELKEVGVTQAVIAASDVETTYGRKTPNEFVAALCQKYPDFFVFGFAGVDPHKGMKAVKELEHAVKVLGLRGCFLTPFLHRLRANDKLYYPLYEKATELDLIVSIYSASSLAAEISMDLGNPLYIDEIAGHFPELKLVCRHTNYPWVPFTVAVAYRQPNVYVDISTVHPKLMPDLIARADDILQDKLLWGSGHPWVELKRAVAWYERLPLKESTKEKLFYSNAARLLGIDEGAVST